MYRGHTTAVVVPAYNEEGFVGDTIASVPAFVDRIYAVEDGSTDGTWAEIRDVADAVADGSDPVGSVDDARVIAIQHEENRGVGGAIKTGYQHARDDEIDLTAVMGGDGQMEPDMLDELFDPIVEGDADYTKGNRFLDRSGRGSMPSHRFVGNAVLGALTKIASGYWTCGDPQNGYTAISLHALETAAIDEMYEFYGYCNDLLVKLNAAQLRVTDVPSPIIYGDEESHIRYRTYIPRVSLMLLRNFLWRIKTNYLAYDFHPLIGAYAAGGVASLASIAALVWALPGIGAAATPAARGALALGFGLFAMVAFTWAMAMDRSANEHLDDAITPGERRAARRQVAPQEPPASETTSVARRGSQARAAPTDREQASTPEERTGPNTASD